MFDAPRSLIALAATCILAPLAAFAGPTPQESNFWQAEVDLGHLPAVADRLPETPLVVDLEAKGRSLGVQGGTLNTMVTRSKDIRQMVVYGYARLVGFNENYELVPDILESFEEEANRKFTLRLRPGHKWSNGDAFTSADFEYWWKHISPIMTS